MQIRTRGHQTEFLRAEYDKTSKRTKQKLIKEADFTPDEKTQFDTWSMGRKLHQERAASVSAALNSGIRINALACAVEDGHPLGDQTALLTALDRLNAALRKRGVTRPPKAKVTPAKPV